MRYLKKRLLLMGIPLGIAFLLSDKTLHDFFITLIGVLFISIPCGLTLWLMSGSKDAASAETINDVFPPKLYPGLPYSWGTTSPFTGESCIATQHLGIGIVYSK